MEVAEEAAQQASTDFANDLVKAVRAESYDCARELAWAQVKDAYYAAIEDYISRDIDEAVDAAKERMKKEYDRAYIDMVETALRRRR